MSGEKSENNDAPPSGANSFGQLLFSSRFWRSQDKLRLAAEIEQKQEDIKKHKDEAREKADQFCNLAKAALQRGDIDGGWKFLQKLEREMVPELDDEQLETRLASAVSEAEAKLQKWRSNAVRRMISDPSNISSEEESESVNHDQIASSAGKGPEILPSKDEREKRIRALQEILYHLHTHHQNVYHKLGKLQSQLRIVGVIVVMSLGFVLLLNSVGFFNPLGEDIQYNLWLAALGGTLGGVLSVAYTVARSDPKRRIPEVSASFLVTLIRPLIGGAIALPILFFMESGFLAFSEDNRSWFLLAFCFLGGFSERWFLGIVENFSSRHGHGNK